MLGRELTRIGLAALRRADGPGGAVPAGISMVGADVLAHSPTSVGEITDRTGLRQGYVSEAVAKLRGQGVVETRPDPRDHRRILVRCTAGCPERMTMAAAEPAEAALRDALGPGTDRETAIAILAALTELSERLRAAGPPDGAGTGAAVGSGGHGTGPRAADATRAEPAPAGQTRIDITRISPGARRQEEAGPGRDATAR